MADNKKVMVNGQDFEVGKIPIRQFAQLILAVEKLPQKVLEEVSFNDLEEINSETIITKFPSVLAHSFDNIIDLISAASQIDKESLEEAGFDELLEVVEAIIEKNNIALIVEKLKNLKATFQKINKSTTKKKKK